MSINNGSRRRIEGSYKLSNSLELDITLALTHSLIPLFNFACFLITSSSLAHRRTQIPYHQHHHAYGLQPGGYQPRCLGHPGISHFARHTDDVSADAEDRRHLEDVL